MNDQFSVSVKPTQELLKSRGLNAGGAVQMFIDSEVLRLSSPYLPFQEGELEQSGQRGTVPGSGEVKYSSPKARYLYYGKVMVGRAPKSVTPKNLNYHGAPQRGAKWFERMKTAHLREILAGAGKIAGGK